LNERRIGSSRATRRVTAMVILLLVGCSGANDEAGGNGPGGGSGNAGAGAPDGGPVDSLTNFELSYRGGTRLRARHVVDVSGNVRLFSYWFDTQLGLACRFLRASDGELRCLPGTSGGNAFEMFRDEGCAKPVTRFVCDPPKFITEADPRSATTCDRRVSVYPVGGKTASPPSHYLTNGSLRRCLANPSPAPAGNYYEIDPNAVPPTTYVRAVDVTGPTWNGIEFHVLEGEDGSRGLSSFRDVARNVECSFRAAGDGVERCLPVRAWSVRSDVFADAACSTRAASGNADGCVTPTFAGSSESDACQTRERLFALGEVASPYAGAGAGCQPLTESGGVYRAVGAEIAPDAFVAAKDDTDAGPGRLRTRRRVFGERPLALGAFDSEREKPCAFRRAADGVVRCLPVNPANGRAEIFRISYADPACTQPVIRWPSSRCGSPETVLVDTAANVCDASAYRVHLVGARVQTPTVFAPSPTSACAPEPGGVNEVFALGAEVPADQFVAATETDL